MLEAQMLCLFVVSKEGSCNINVVSFNVANNAQKPPYHTQSSKFKGAG